MEYHTDAGAPTPLHKVKLCKTINGLLQGDAAEVGVDETNSSLPA